MYSFILQLISPFSASFFLSAYPDYTIPSFILELSYLFLLFYKSSEFNTLANQKTYGIIKLLCAVISRFIKFIVMRLYFGTLYDKSVYYVILKTFTIAFIFQLIPFKYLKMIKNSMVSGYLITFLDALDSATV